MTVSFLCAVLNIAGNTYDTVGNVMLLGLKRKCVHVRRHLTPEERRAYMNDCVKNVREGAVLVSPFISPYEAQVRDFALKEGHAVMVLVHQSISDYATFPEPLLSALLHGQALILAPPYTQGHPPYRVPSPARNANHSIRKLKT